MEQRVYNNQIVEGHSLYQLCHSTLNEISNRDYPDTDYFNPDIACLDMDFYEQKVLRRGQADNTVDAVIGVCAFENNRLVRPHLLLVEFRMNYQGVSNLSKTEMERKVEHSKALLGGEQPIHKESIFVFGDHVAPRAVNWFDRQGRAGGEIKNCRPCSVTDFPNIVKSPSDFPYIPIHASESIRQSIEPYCEKADWINFRKQITYWCTEAYKYQYKNPSEFVHIGGIVKDIWRSFRDKKYAFDEEEEFEVELLEENFESLLT